MHCQPSRSSQPSASGLSRAFSRVRLRGRITAVSTQGGEATPLLYTIGTNQLRVEVTDTNRPHPVNIVERSSGALTLLFPQTGAWCGSNRRQGHRAPPPACYHARARRHRPAVRPAAAPPAMPAPPAGLPPGLATEPSRTGAAPMPGMPPMPEPPAGCHLASGRSASPRSIGHASMPVMP